MLNFKRAAIIGSMLAALSVTAFAADNNAADQAQKPSMKERVNAILHEDGADQKGPQMDKRGHGPKDFRHHGPRDGRHMGPQGDMRGPGHGPMVTEESMEKWNSMTEEQRQEAIQKWENMTPDERKEAMDKHRQEMEKKRAEWENMTEEQRQEAIQKREAEMQKRAEERKAEHDKRAKEAMNKLTDAQKAEVEQFIKDDMAQRQARKEKLHNMTEEQREAVRLNMPRKQHQPRFNGEHRQGPRPDGHHGPQGDRPMPPAPPADASQAK